MAPTSISPSSLFSTQVIRSKRAAKVKSTRRLFVVRFLGARPAMVGEWQKSLGWRGAGPSRILCENSLRARANSVRKQGRSYFVSGAWLVGLLRCVAFLRGGFVLLLLLLPLPLASLAPGIMLASSCPLSSFIKRVCSACDSAFTSRRNRLTSS